MSQRISLMLVDDAGRQLVLRRSASNSAQVSNWNGSPAVGSCWNIIARLLA